MPIEINGKRYYRTSEACRKTGISRATLFQWISQGVLTELLRDRKEWRLFTEDDLQKIKAEKSKIKVEKVRRVGITQRTALRRQRS
jgi:predicted site-specific integrase-resolvase